jgi:invasion protein IalB
MMLHANHQNIFVVGTIEDADHAATGCFARIGFTSAEVAAFKAGVAATMTIVPAAAPDEKVALKVSLKGFT